MEFHIIKTINDILIKKQEPGDKRSTNIENLNMIVLLSKRINENTYQISDMTGSVNVTFQGDTPSNLKV